MATDLPPAPNTPTDLASDRSHRGLAWALLLFAPLTALWLAFTFPLLVPIALATFGLGIMLWVPIFLILIVVSAANARSNFCSAFPLDTSGASLLHFVTGKRRLPAA